MNKLANNHAQIYKLEVAISDPSKIVNSFGKKTIKISNDLIFTDCLISSAELSEKKDNENNSYLLELKATTPKIDLFDPEKTISDRNLIFRIYYTNNDVKILGTPQNPVFCTYTKDGNPEIVTLQISHYSVSPTKTQVLF